jgi:hypothetical protein
MNIYEKLLRYLSDNDGSIFFGKDYQDKRLITIKIKNKIKCVTNTVTQAIKRLEKELEKYE